MSSDGVFKICALILISMTELFRKKKLTTKSRLLFSQKRFIIDVWYGFKPLMPGGNKKVALT